MRRILLALVLAAMMAVVPACAAVAAPAPGAGAPIGGCPPNFDLYTVEDVLQYVPDPNGLQSFDVNGDGSACVLFAAENKHGQ